MVYLSKELCKLLRVWQKESAWEKKQRGRGGLEEEDYLFRQPGGDPMVPGTFTFRFKKILREGNLPDNLNVHSLRHTNASMLIAQGVDVRTVALGTHNPAPLDIMPCFDRTKAAQEKLAAMGL
ncbi:MAG: tyrosine-type recombinase/integrase [Ruthenibacterium lactatiformans]